MSVSEARSFRSAGVKNLGLASAAEAGRMGKSAAVVRSWRRVFMLVMVDAGFDVAGAEFADELDHAADDGVDEEAAFFGGGFGGVARGSGAGVAGEEFLEEDGGGFLEVPVEEFGFLGGEVGLGLFHLDEVGAEVEQDRGFEFTAVGHAAGEVGFAEAGD